MFLNETLSIISAANTTINATNTTGAIPAAAPVSLGLVATRLLDLVAAPFRHTEMLWIIFPLLFTMILMEFYYAKHYDEELGWGAALANSMILIFVAIDLIKQSFGHATPWTVLRYVALSVFSGEQFPIPPQVFVLIAFLGTLGIALGIINYFHLMPGKLAYIISGHSPINYLAYFAIAIVYSTGTQRPIPFDLSTLVAGALLFVLLLAAIFGVRRWLRIR